MATIEEIRENAIQALNLAKEQFQEGGATHNEHVSLITRLENPDTIFVPGKGLASLRKKIVVAERAMLDLVEADWDEASEIGLDEILESQVMATRLRSLLDKIDNTVTFPMILDDLRGTWRDDTVYKAVKDLEKSFAAYESAPSVQAPSP